MTILSTLYSEKVTTEHPLALWLLNDKVDYVSYVAEADREFENPLKWDVINATATNETAISDVPFSSSNVSKIEGTVPAVAESISLLSIADIPIASLEGSYGNFMISGHFKIGSSYIDKVYIGYQYFDPVSLSTKEELQERVILDTELNEWVFISKTFALPAEELEDIKFLIKFNKGIGGANPSDYILYVNGFTFGQWAENFARTSLGTTTIPVPTSIAIDPSLEAVPAYPSGATGSTAYYLANGTELFCKNFGVPIVFGSDTITKVYENTAVAGAPSLIFPGFGFLNEKGRHNKYTAEMWLRINSDSSQARKIFGPIVGTDGLYVDGGFLTFVIGNNIKSHYVGKWFRPMLVHIRYVENNVTVVLNGEQVIDIEYTLDDISFPLEYNNNDKSQDWLGFYAYPDVHPLEVDSFVLYSYYVPLEVTKRRFVWGQAIQAPEISTSSGNATTAFFDYSYADYKVNYNYPDFANWKQAYFNNINTDKNSLQIPTYELPIFSFGDLNYDSWISSLKTAQSLETDKYISFDLPIVGSNKPYIYFKNLNILNDRVQSFYGIFKFKSGYNTSTGSDIFFILKNERTRDTLTAIAAGDEIYYVANINGQSIQIGDPIQVQDVSKKFVVGIDILKMSNSDYNLKAFLSDFNNLSLKVGGDGSANVMESKLYRFGVDSGYNNKKLLDYYSENPDGIFSKEDTGNYVQNSTDGDDLMEHTANYTLVAREKFGSYYLNIDVAGYWQDYMPLSYFSKYILDYNQNGTYDLDQLQFNIDYPEPIERLALTLTQPGWTYLELFTEYREPIDQTYASLDNSLFSGWDNYSDMQDQETKYRYYDTQDATIKSYVSFQETSIGSKKDLIDYTTKAKPQTKATVDPDSSIDPWETTAYEVINGSIIYPPTTSGTSTEVDYNDLLLVYHLDFNVKDSLFNKVVLKNLQLASQVYERTDFTKIGTKFGQSVYPYSKTGFYYNFKAKNPIEIYKGSTPHLYLTRDSGMEIHGEFDEITDRGIIIPINENQSQGVKVTALQMWIKFANDVFPTGPTKIFTIDSKNDIYDFYLLGDESTQRGSIYAFNRSTGQNEYDISYYINGVPVDTIYLDNEEWSCIAVVFNNLLDFDQYSGKIQLNGPLLYNNVSYFNYDENQAVQSVATRSWGDVKTTEAVDNLWSTWSTSTALYDATWTSVRNTGATTVYDINLSDIYKRYIGTNRIVIDDATKGLTVNPEKLKVYKDIVTSSYLKSAV